MIHAFLDTDVILDLLTDRRPWSDHAEEIFRQAVNGNVKLYTSPLSFSNAWYVLSAHADTNRITTQFRKLLPMLSLTPLDREVIQQAVEFPLPDLEDALQHFSAAREGMISCIVTRTPRDYRGSRIAVLTPEIFVRQIKGKA